MDQISLYRKYRPHNFDNLIGQDHVRTTLINAIKNDHVAHAYLFTGPRGTGKTSSARLIAKALLCSNLIDGHEPCDQCDLCLDINTGRLIDLIEIDAASNRGIDEVRELKEKINFAPSRAKYKVYIIDEVHMMTKEAFNALLKTLEEPPAHAYFILATTEVHKIPDTIISRCQRFDFRRLTVKALMTRLSYICQKEEIQAEDKALEVIARYVNGGMRDAIGLVEQLTVDGKLEHAKVEEILGLTGISLLDDLFNVLCSGDTKGAIKIIHELHDQGSDLKQFTHEFVQRIREKMLEAVHDGKTNMSRSLIKMIEIFQEAQRTMTAAIPQLALEIASIKLAGPVKEEVVVAPPVEAVQAPVAKEQPSVEEAPVVETVSSEQKKVEVVATGETLAFTIESIKENWARVHERVTAPALRMSLKNGSPTSLNDSKLVLTFNSNFHKSKVLEHDYRVELENIIQELFGHGVKMEGLVKELDIKPTMQEESYHEAPPEPAGGVAVEAALDIFGGEVVG